MQDIMLSLNSVMSRKNELNPVSRSRTFTTFLTVSITPSRARWDSSFTTFRVQVQVFGFRVKGLRLKGLGIRVQAQLWKNSRCIHDRLTIHPRVPRDLLVILFTHNPSLSHYLLTLRSSRITYLALDISLRFNIQSLARQVTVTSYINLFIRRDTLYGVRLEIRILVPKIRVLGFVIWN